MDFLGLYNLFMALAIAGACGATNNYDPACDDYGVDSAYVDDSGGSALPPAWTVINRPPTVVDSGYNPTFYWNRPNNEYADENGYYPGYGGGQAYAGGYGYEDGDRYADNGYGPANRGYGAAHPAYTATAPGMNYGAATTDAGYQGVYGEYQAAYPVEADEYGYGYYQRPLPYSRERHERRAAMARMPHDQTHGVTTDLPAVAHDYGDDHPMQGADDHRGGYNGHDRHMFENNRSPAKPASANYQGHDNNNDGRNRPHQ